VIVLDTHVLYWLATDDPALGAEARGIIARALADGEVAASAISYWELAMLADKGRIEADDIEAMRRIAIDAGIAEIALDGATAVLAARLAGFHKDPADRMIAATAMKHNARLLTADERILSAMPPDRCHDARR
jgi:PIN domain nuclease of toxin-antitoxin system